MSLPQGCAPEALLLDPGVSPGSLCIEGGTWIGVDWGSSQVRAWLLDDTGAVLDARRGQRRGSGDWSSDFAIVVAGWPPLPVLACGMVGARTGWIETPYASCPATLAEIASARRSPPGNERISILGGVAARDSTGRLRDVMRGEETLVFGAELTEEAVVVLPGTHSKWVWAAPDRILDVCTFLSGDLFAALTAHTVLTGSVAPAAVTLGPGLEDGLVRGLAGELSQSLFQVRVRDLDGDCDREQAWRFLSGMIVGDEVRHGLAGSGDRPVTIVADLPLAEIYARAFDLAGRTVARRVGATDAACRGLFRLRSHVSC